MRTLAFLVALLGACKPGGVTPADELCAKAGAMYAQCEAQGSNTPQQWEIVIDRWRGLCRASLTGETKQLLPNALQLWEQMDEETRAGLKVQAQCTAAATTCAQYAACDQ